MKSPPRISLPNPMLAMDEKREDTVPSKSERRAISTISAPVLIT